jgi:hypothetical protein
MDRKKIYVIILGVCCLLLSPLANAKVKYHTSVTRYVDAGNEEGVPIWDVKEDECFNIWKAGGVAFFNDARNVSVWRHLVSGFGFELLAHSLSHIAERACRRPGCGLAVDALTRFALLKFGGDRMRVDIRHNPRENGSAGGAFTYFRPKKLHGLGAAKDTIWIDQHLEIERSGECYHPGEKGVLYLAPHDRRWMFRDNTGLYWIRLDVYKIVHEDEGKIKYYELEEDN